MHVLIIQNPGYGIYDMNAHSFINHFIFTFIFSNASVRKKNILKKSNNNIFFLSTSHVANHTE